MADPKLLVEQNLLEDDISEDVLNEWEALHTELGCIYLSMISK